MMRAIYQLLFTERRPSRLYMKEDSFVPTSFKHNLIYGLLFKIELSKLVLLVIFSDRKSKSLRIFWSAMAFHVSMKARVRRTSAFRAPAGKTE